MDIYVFKINLTAVEVADHLKPEINDLSTFLSDRAKYALEKGYGVSYTAYHEGDLVGFFAINTGHIRFDNDALNREHELDELNKKNYKNFPAVKIVQLAVHSDYQRNSNVNIGTQLITAIEAISCNISKHVGIRFLKVDALADYRTLKFYTRVGFKPHYDNAGLKMYTEIMERRYIGLKPSVSMYLDLQKTGN